MPKKRTYNFKSLQGSSSSKPAATNHGDTNSGPSVNERLSELRTLEGKDAAAKKRLLAESVNQRSVPQDIQKVLGVPQSAPPRPKVAVRMRDRLRTPGPAPPKSWLSGSSRWWTPSLAQRGGRGLKKRADSKDRSRPRELFRFARLTGLCDIETGDGPPALLHLALKAIAESWHLLEEEDYPALEHMPLRLRLLILSYIGSYGIALDVRSFEALLQGSDKVQALDLAGLIGYSNLTLKKIQKLVEKASVTSPNHGSQNLVADSWEEDDTLEAALRPSLSASRFSTLTHLCLSHPGPKASWADLLALSKHVAQATHLSLAYWPRPTLTPNLVTATVSDGRSPDVTAGGSHYYSEIDHDMAEPASIIRRLSANLLCLEWLDVEGCVDWIPALAYVVVPPGPETARPWLYGDNLVESDSVNVSIFATNWKKLAYIRCAQGWLPGRVGAGSLFHNLPAGSFSQMLCGALLRHLEAVDGDLAVAEQSAQDVLDFERKRTRLWLENEHGVRMACWRIGRARRKEGCPLIEMDLGWQKRDMSQVGHCTGS